MRKNPKRKNDKLLITVLILIAISVFGYAISYQFKHQTYWQEQGISS